jgi:hypothetical protein
VTQLQLDLAQLNAEALGWLPLATPAGEQGYLHVGDPESDVITVVGVPDAAMAGMNVLWVG